MSNRTNESLPEQMSQGRTALDLVDNHSKPPTSTLHKAKEAVTKPVKQLAHGDFDRRERFESVDGVHEMMKRDVGIQDGSSRGDVNSGREGVEGKEGGVVQTAFH